MASDKSISSLSPGMEGRALNAATLSPTLFTMTVSSVLNLLCYNERSLG